MAQSGIAERKQGRRKYNNTPCEETSAEGVKIRFDSMKERNRYHELMLLLHAEKIRDLRLQPQFTLQEAYTTPEGNRVRAIRYQADFSYELKSDGIIGTEGGSAWLSIVEDVKSDATKTRVYAIKRKLMQDKYGITIHEV